MEVRRLHPAPLPGFEARVQDLAAAADYVYETYGLTPVFFPIEPRLDIAAAQRVAQKMTAPHHLLTEAFTAAQTIGILSRMQVVVSMRLHGLIFSASQGVPLVGIVYDQKVSSFLSYIGQDLYEGLDQLTRAPEGPHRPGRLPRQGPPLPGRQRRKTPPHGRSQPQSAGGVCLPRQDNAALTSSRELRSLTTKTPPWPLYASAMGEFAEPVTYRVARW